MLYTLSTEGTQSTVLGDRFQYNFAVSYRLTSLGSSEHPMFHGATRTRKVTMDTMVTSMAMRARGRRSTSCSNSTASGTPSK